MSDGHITFNTFLIQALNEMLSCNIHVVHTDQPDIVVGARADGTQNGYTLVLGYMPDIQHYVSLEPMMRYVLEWVPVDYFN
jgi:hypothetical protein